VACYVRTEILPSKQKKIRLLNKFIDTSGLVDGDKMYPFNINRSIERLGKFFLEMSHLFHIDLRFVLLLSWR
jgi:hypothetical protein